GELTLAVLLIVGFALHNTTEGFGIVGPLAATGVRASWGGLGLAGRIGGGPTLLGTIVGTSFSSSYLYVGCLALAGGALLYVIGELLPLGRRLSWEVTLWGLVVGFLLVGAPELDRAGAGGCPAGRPRPTPPDGGSPRPSAEHAGVAERVGARLGERTGRGRPGRPGFGSAAGRCRCRPRTPRPPSAPGRRPSAGANSALAWMRAWAQTNHARPAS